MTINDWLSVINDLWLMIDYQLMIYNQCSMITDWWSMKSNDPWLMIHDNQWSMIDNAQWSIINHYIWWSIIDDDQLTMIDV